MLVWLNSARALVTGVLEIMAAILLRREIENEWWLAIGGALSIVFGSLLAVWPGAAPPATTASDHATRTQQRG